MRSWYTNVDYVEKYINVYILDSDSIFINDDSPIELQNSSYLKNDPRTKSIPPVFFFQIKQTLKPFSKNNKF